MSGYRTRTERTGAVAGLLRLGWREVEVAEKLGLPLQLVVGVKRRMWGRMTRWEKVKVWAKGVLR